MSSPRVTLRQVAEAAGLSLATVSYALRNHPKIAAATRRRVQTLAGKLGYRPDPEIERYMARVRNRGTDGVESALALLNFVSAGGVDWLREDPFTRTLAAGAARRAEALGYRLEAFDVGGGLSVKRLRQILEARGIQGVLLATPVPPAARTELPWKRTFVVATVPPEGLPPVARVHAHQFANMNRLCEAALKRGFRRIAMSTTERLDRLQRRVVTSVFAWHAWRQPKRFQAEIFFSNESDAGREVDRLRAWFRRVQPDAVLCSDEWEWRRLETTVGADTLRNVGCATFGNKRPALSGIDPQPGLIGSAAIDLLTAHLQRHEIGLPVSPKTTLIEGVFEDEGTL